MKILQKLSAWIDRRWPRSMLGVLGDQQPPDMGFTVVRVGAPGLGVVELLPPREQNGWLWEIVEVGPCGRRVLVGLAPEPWAVARAWLTARAATRPPEADSDAN